MGIFLWFIVPISCVNLLLYWTVPLLFVFYRYFWTLKIFLSFKGVPIPMPQVGIPLFGCALSSVLLNFYLGDFDRKVLSTNHARNGGRRALVTESVGRGTIKLSCPNRRLVILIRLGLAPNKSTNITLESTY